MKQIFVIAVRNLSRYRRRTMLTGSLVAIGVLFVLVFEAAAGSFKGLMIGQITDSMLGHLQIHRKGYVASIETLPLSMNLKPDAVKKIESELDKLSAVEAYSPRVKFGGVFSTFTESTSVRVNGVYPEREVATVPLLTGRIVNGKPDIAPGVMLVPELLARGMQVKPGDTVVLLATNADGSVNGKQMQVGGILSSISGPGGRDAYVHMDDAMEVLRMEEPSISEIAVRLKDFGQLESVYALFSGSLGSVKNKQGKPAFEVHTWESLAPFSNVARMIDILTIFIRLMLVSVVLVSVMNVMIMAVYERVREIGTMAAIGTLPGTIRAMFLVEGLVLGILGALAGTGIGLALIGILRIVKLSYNFGQQQGLVLQPSVGIGQVLILAVIVIAVAALASLQPAIKASRMEPIEALRHS